MKNLVFLLCMSLLSAGCGRPTEKAENVNSFTTDVMLKTTPVKNQGRSSLCWVYAMLATIETNHLMEGDSVNLSPDYVARMLLNQEIRKYYLSGCNGSVKLRGMGSKLVSIIEKYGAEPFDSYNAGNKAVNYNALTRRLMLASRNAINLEDLQHKTDNIIDEAVDYMPAKYVHMLGAEYTPLEFAHSVCRKDEYTAMTSFTHHPFGKSFILETPDNDMNDEFMNVPIDSMMRMIISSVRHSRAVCWEGDISDVGFSWKDGVADIPLRHVTQQMRQYDFETRRTTDDHVMEIVGLAHKGNEKFFIMKNSWGESNKFGGYIYVSYNYLKLKTIAVFM